jgi:hypothetical protein
VTYTGVVTDPADEGISSKSNNAPIPFRTLAFF